MSEPLKDVRTKISSRAWAFLEAESRATGREQAEILRELIHEWASERERVHKVTTQLLKATGNEGE
jgi:hypothetical protein